MTGCMIDPCHWSSLLDFDVVDRIVLNQEFQNLLLNLSERELEFSFYYHSVASNFFVNFS